MAYQVLARKWRPKTFADLVGQEHVVKALRNALDEGRLHHAYLLTGTRGVGKTTIARILAKSLNCETPSHGEPCGVCQSCTQIDAGRYVDLLEIDAASNTGIDNIREVLENAQYAPTAGKYKVYIIDEVHMLSKSAFNAMLKTLEEPPEHVKFILATTDPHKVPITVLSRCLQFVLRNMTTQQVADHLAHVLTVEQIAYEAPALQLLGRAAMGSMRDALSLLDQAIAMGSGSVTEHDVRQMIGAVDKRYLYELLQGIVNQDGEALLLKAQEMAARAIGFDNALSELAMLLQRLALAKTVPAAVAGDPEHETLLRLSQYLSGEQIQLYYQCAIHGKHDLSLAPDEYAGFVMTLLRMLAFAPIAAKAHDAGGVIEGTQLHNPEYAEPAAKKPLILPDRPSETPVSNTAADVVQETVQTASHHANRPSESSGGYPAEDTPQWEDTAESAGLSEPPAAAAENTQTAEPATATPATPDTLAAGPLSTVSATNETLPSEDTAAAAEPVFAEEAVGAGDNTFQTASVEETGFGHGFYDNGADYPDEPPYFPEDDAYPLPPVDLPVEDMFGAEAGQTEEAAEDGGADGETEAEAAFAALPDLAPENWPQIAKRLAVKLGAAQMIAQNAAFTRYDAENGLLVFALTQEARATTNKERLDKIQNTLAEAYGLTLKLQTEAWRDDAGWETPVMRRNRLQIEGRQQAQQLLEADPAARQILQLFEAQWLPETLELKQAQE
ncbi:DNA polymerase III subunit gamma/tau [Neisseria dentiae]|uniref:DNA polymerase III subunit gamma/tau n=1 Tax=Neisseria dentiae TaxID=194197 RepID=A0A1X3D2U8_9NEIS|nr:DNA polymerase III subunit gamma/tau [Neisseria dentiae]OSI14106.1 DNA polymerase III subunit gamma/tau [Neisseria dentiae]QMT46005.1 DNA polymerase III subunit gamma/tau [Neisseria dentiae]STZ52048.1 DNA polymerase III subunits gamma and tau [Neisseria dentiae]